MTIAVTTPTGNVGSHVVRMLCQAGERPRLLLRDPDRLDAGLREHVDTAVGDLRDAGYVAESTRGVVGMAMGESEGFTPEQPRTAPTTTPGTLAGWAATRLRPAL